jgi:hypothetical protein
MLIRDVKMNLVSVLVTPENINNGLQDDLAGEPEGPFMDIEKIKMYPLLHVVGSLSFPAAAVYLCQAGDTGFNEVTQHIPVDGFNGSQVERGGMRSGTYYRHIADKNVPELRQLIHIGFSQVLAEAGYAGVIRYGLTVFPVLVRIMVTVHHRPEFKTNNSLVIKSPALLLKE